MPTLTARRPWVGVIALLFAVAGASLAQQAAPAGPEVCSAALAHGGVTLAELGARTAGLRYGAGQPAGLDGDPTAQALAALTQSPIEVSSACLWDKPLVG